MIFYRSGMIYFTGYAKFFGTDMSDDCDDVSWSTWAHVSNPRNPPGFASDLTKLLPERL